MYYNKLLLCQLLTVETFNSKMLPECILAEKKKNTAHTNGTQKLHIPMVHKTVTHTYGTQNS